MRYLALTLSALALACTLSTAALRAEAPASDTTGPVDANPKAAPAPKFSDITPVPPVPIVDPQPPSKNAYALYMQAIEAIKDTRYEQEDLALSDSDKKQILDDNAQAFKLADQAKAYSFLAPPIRTFNIDFGSFTSIRSLARLLRFRSEQEAVQGEWGDAASSALDAIELGLKMQQGGPLIQSLVGVTIESIGRKPLADAIPNLDAREAADAAARLAAIDAERTPYTAIMKEEEVASEASLLEVMRDPKAWAEFLKSVSLADSAPTRQGLLDAYIKFMNRSIATAGKPFVQSAKPVHDKGMDELESVGDPDYRVKFDADRTDNALMITQLGLQAFRKNYGEYPDKLNQISPVFLKTLPADPFASSGPVRYIKTESSYILYSVGPDGKDDGGAPIDDPTPNVHDVTGRLRHIVTASSKGDIVAGVNTF